MNNKRTNQKGFTLIELMIVVAVIGVLSAIAMPQYQKYVAKSEVASALSTLTGAKTNVEAYTVENGMFPDGGTAGQKTDDLGIPAMPLGTASFTSAAANTGSISFTFGTSASDGVSTLVSGKTFSLTRNSTGSWNCSSSDLDDNVLPKNCQ
ncbi:pilin [Vibrio kanaloae]|uniref:pilin n=1 Tax=Vibrio kanaloae TaxID=170673 RepID=UPI00098984CA|nr:pilin [Vibrio kanaloae]QPK03435.1 pilin [Vibrio kanaloae]